MIYDSFSLRFRARNSRKKPARRGCHRRRASLCQLPSKELDVMKVDPFCEYHHLNSSAPGPHHDGGIRPQDPLGGSALPIDNANISGECGPPQVGSLVTRLVLKVQINSGSIVVVVGRAAWALLELLAAGDTGCSYIDKAAPRWSSYIHKLRKMDLVIDTVREA